jgi:prepilin-type N-terminal cleavage/methylation domain-containing protein
MKKKEKKMEKKMKKKRRYQKGFTLIEMIMVVVILGLLAAIALPVFTNVQVQAQVANEQGVAGGVRAGIATFFVRDNDTNNQPDLVWPTDVQLDAGAAAACTVAAPCFEGVLAQGGITARWTKATANTWTGPAGDTWTYTAATGAFACTAGANC